MNQSNERHPDRLMEVDVELDVREGSCGILGASPEIGRVMHMIDRVAPTDALVLVTGESGTGKELVAHEIHRRSARHSGPFIAVNCGAIPSTLLESELFGHEKGSFTGADSARRGLVEHAAGGILFLDEITEMPVEMQVPLLRFIESRRFYRIGGTRELSADVRIVAATNRNPAEAVAAGRLREDLYYRLAVFPIEVPPLRSRAGDIAPLARHFLEQLNTRSGLAKHFAPGSLEAAEIHSWPGNVRELRHAVERAYILAGDSLDLRDALDRAPVAFTPGARARGPVLQITVGSRLCDVERAVIEATLGHYAGSKREAAEALGCSLKTLYNKLNGYSRTALSQEAFP